MTGVGVLEFSGGVGHELPTDVSALVKVSGRGVVTFAGDSLSIGRGITVQVRIMLARCAAFDAW